ncbi:YceD family protein [Devosia sp. XJ19-1]|uniref:YceD family protein n=1 Tax=Devosia ureilytica TaxID=2952754 RepID=A0A9Q4AL28_9HYPH|nr:YceD family protein [Devosia ureilytica]MCP8882502.1 YceD family protein [Devosia ureilytica]MCP8885611.1 YceD family protein [Devosia ureilytica]
MSEHAEPIFDAVVRIDKLPAAGRSISVNANDAECKAIAEAMNIVSVERFSASLTIVPLRGGLRAQGRLDAQVTQASVVSFEPVPETISEDIDRVFLPAPRDEHAPVPGAEIFIDLENDDFPDHIDGPEVDLSALLLESLALALDPYPRKSGESLDDLGIAHKDVEEGPFAKLAGLKNENGDKD